MTLHPITVVENVIEEYRRYLRTEFRARDPKLREALEEELTSGRFLAQEPFFQAHRPFKAASAKASCASTRSSRHHGDQSIRCFSPDFAGPCSGAS